jgi:hypothetical protein
VKTAFSRLIIKVVAEPEREKTEGYTAVGNALMCLAMSTVLFVTPSYIGLSNLFGPIAGLILSIVVYFAAVVFLIFVMSFMSTILREHPELRRVVPWLGENDDAWQSAFGTATFLAIASSIHYVAIGIFGAEGFIAAIAKLAVLLFSLGAASQAVSAIDAFFVRPLLASSSRGQEATEQSITRVRKIGTLAFTAIALAASIATILEVFVLK